MSRHRPDIVRDHMECRAGHREYAVSTLIFPNGTSARWNSNLVEFAAAMARGWTRAYEASVS